MCHRANLGPGPLPEKRTHCRYIEAVSPPDTREKHRSQTIWNPHGGCSERRFFTDYVDTKAYQNFKREKRERETTKKKDNTRKATVQALLVLLVFSAGTMSLISHQLTQQEVLTKGTMERERDRESIPVRLVSRVLADSCWLNWISPLGCARATPVISCCWQALAIR